MHPQGPLNSKLGRSIAVRLPLQPSPFLSCLICAVHGLLFLVLLLFSELPPLLFLFLLLLVLLSACVWLLRHWSMAAFLLCWQEDIGEEGSDGENSEIHPMVMLQGRSQELLHAPKLHLEWQHYELMIWRTEIHTRLLAKQLSGFAEESSFRSAPNVWVLLCARLWALLPAHSFCWRLILLRKLHDPQSWRLLCQRVRLLT